jgi:hypothetical protein
MARDYSVVSGWMGLATRPSDPPDGHKNRLMALIQTTPQAEAQVPAPAAGQATRPALTVLPSQPEAQAEAQAPGATTTPAAPVTPGNVTDLGEYRERRNNRALLQALLGVAAVAIFLLALWAWTSNSDKLDAENQVAALQAQYNTLASKPNLPPGYAVLPLPPQPGYEKVNASVVYNPQTSDVQLAASGLAPLPAGKIYELWFLKPQGQGNPAPAGTFSPDSSGNASHSVTGPQPMNDYAGFAVSEEPTPGSSAPTGPILVAGTFPTP